MSFVNQFLQSQPQVLQNRNINSYEMLTCTMYLFLSHKSNLTILFEHVYENAACKNILFSLITLHMTMFIVIYSVVKHVALFTALLQISRKINQKKIPSEWKLLNRAPSG